MTLGHLQFTDVGISDDQFLEELRAERRLSKAVGEMRRAIEDVNNSSTLVEIEPSAFVNFIDDELPSDEDWAEKLSTARGQ